MATWPSTFPKVLAEGYSVNPGQQFVRTEMETGPARQRRITEAPNRNISASVLLNDEQLAEFDTWFDTELLGGSIWFSGIPLHIGQGMQSYSARFVAQPKYTHAGALRWKIGMELEVQDA